MFAEFVHYMKQFGNNDSIATDRGFLISDYLENIDASLNKLLNSREQLRKAEVKESQPVGSVRIY